jgi:hypothetical protein
MNDAPLDDEKLRLLREAWQVGIDNGDAGALDFEALKREARHRRVGLTAELPEEWIIALQERQP